MGRKYRISYLMGAIIRMPGERCTQAQPCEGFAKVAALNQKLGQIQHCRAAVLQGLGTLSLPLALETRA